VRFSLFPPFLIEPTALYILTSTSWGGLELYVCTLAVTLAQSGWKPVVLCVPGSKVEQFLREHSIETYPSSGSGYFNVHDILLVQKIIRKRGVSVVHSHTRFDIWTASWAIRGFPKVKLFHSVYMNVAPKKDILHRWIYRRANGIFSSSEIINREIRERYPIEPSRVHLLRYGIALNDFVPNETVRRETRLMLDVKEHEILVGVLGRIDVQKGVREFAESYLLLPKEKQGVIKYLIIGEPTILRTKDDGSQEYEPGSKACDEYITSFIKQNYLEKNIIRVGFRKMIIPYLNAMDIFVLPSYAEMYSLSVINAMAMGLPVIGTKAGGTEEQIENGVRGTLIEPRDPAAIARAVEHYVDHPEIRAAHGAEAEKYAWENHSMEKTIKTLLDFYSGNR